MRTSVAVPCDEAIGVFRIPDGDGIAVVAENVRLKRRTTARVTSIGALAALDLFAILFDLQHGTLTVAESFIMLSVFAGSVVSGLAGFAFSAIAGSLMLHWMTPLEMVPLLPACSITAQLFSIVCLKQSIVWRRVFALSCGGLIGIPVGVMLLEHVNARILATGIGGLLIFYSAIMLWRPLAQVRKGGVLTDLAAGIAGGVMGGSIAFPGAIPSLWYCLAGVPKETQRGAIQPFILVMQFATMLYFSRIGLLSATTMHTFIRCIPAVLGGSLIGLMIFRSMGDRRFKHIMLLLLMLSGISLTM
jgi:uncharacterized membrane protein YfcA